MFKAQYFYHTITLILSMFFLAPIFPFLIFTAFCLLIVCIINLINESQGEEANKKKATNCELESLFLVRKILIKKGHQIFVLFCFVVIVVD